MSELIIKTQSELEAIPKDFNGTIYIEGGTFLNPLVLKINFEYAYVVTRGTAVIEMWESSQVKEMWGSSQVNVMWGSSQVNVMWESSQVKEMWGSSQVNVMWGSSQVKEMWGSSQVNVMWGEAMVSAYGTNKITCRGYNVVRTYNANKDSLTLVMNPESHLILIPDKQPTFEDYKMRYPVDIIDGMAILYKAVHLKDGKYIADYTPFEYVIDKIHAIECDPTIEKSCSSGLHVSHLSFAIEFGRNWPDVAILECAVLESKIVVAKDCDGKVRTSELHVIREVPKEEWI